MTNAQRQTRAAALNLLEILALTPADAPRVAAARRRLAEARHAEDGEAYGVPTELCGCVRCVDARADAMPLHDIGRIRGPMFPGWRYACELCGNKRCPHHAWHGFVCTESNAVGQVGVPLAAPHSPAQPDVAHPAPCDTPAPPEAVERRLEGLERLAIPGLSETLEDLTAIVQRLEQRLAALEALILATVPAGYVTGAEVERLREVLVQAGDGARARLKNINGLPEATHE